MLLDIAINSVIKGSILLALVLLFVQNSQNKTAASKHNQLAAALIVLLAVPLLELAPKLGLQVLPANADVSTQHSSSWPFSQLTLAPFIIGIYLTGVLLGLVKVLLDYAALRSQLKTATHYDNELLPLHVNQLLDQSSRVITLWQLESLSSPITVGERHPKIIVPAQFFSQPENIVSAALQHELAHIRRHDWLIQLIIRVVVALFWFNPLVHYCARNLLTQAEIAADDEVVLAGVDAPGYAGVLLSYSQQRSPVKEQKGDAQNQGLPLWMAMLGPGLAGRIQSLTQKTPRRYDDGFPLTESLVLFVLLLLPFTVLKAVPMVEAVEIVAVHNTVELDGSHYEPIVCGFPPLTDFFEPNKSPTQPKFQFAPWNPAVERVSVRQPFELSAPAPMLGHVDLASLTPHISRSGFMPTVSVMPKYPSNAVRRKLEGFVDVVFDIRSDGSVENARVLYSEPGRVFDRAALKAIRQSRYAIHQVNGASVRVRGVENRYVFRLTEPGLKNRKQPGHFPSETLIAQGVKHDYL